MPSFEDTRNQAEQLVDEYLHLYQERTSLEAKIESLKQKIVSFSKKSNMKTLKKGNNLLYIFHKIKTVFPKSNEKGRKEIEIIMRKSNEWQQAITFDIVKLGQAYDKKKLTPQLMQKLTPFTKKEEVIKLYLKDLTKDKNQPTTNEAI